MRSLNVTFFAGAAFSRFNATYRVENSVTWEPTRSPRNSSNFATELKKTRAQFSALGKQSIHPVDFPLVDFRIQRANGAGGSEAAFRSRELIPAYPRSLSHIVIDRISDCLRERYRVNGRRSDQREFCFRSFREPGLCVFSVGFAHVLHIIRMGGSVANLFGQLRQLRGQCLSFSV